MELLTKLGVEDVTGLFGAVAAFIGACAFLASIITEALKSIKAVDKLPSKLTCYLVSLVLTPLAYVSLMAYMKRPALWFEVFASFLAAFVVAKVSMGGWEDITELMGRMLKKKG